VFQTETTVVDVEVHEQLARELHQLRGQNIYNTCTQMDFLGYGAEMVATSNESILR
jgi:hypothetical protein